ncbi:hypothetical protein JCM8097_006187 [Rhodosporidiobolus ruineniae]
MDHSNPDGASRRIRFSLDDGQPEEGAQPYPAPTTYINPFADAGTDRRHSLPPHLQPYGPTGSPSSSPAPTSHLTGDHENYGLAPPPPAQTVGSGLPGSGVDRSGFGNTAPVYPFDQHNVYPSTPPLRFAATPAAQPPPPPSRPRFGSEDTLVGDSSSAPPPLKPALRRSATEEHLRLQAERQAAGIVNSHLAGRPQQAPSPAQFLAPPPANQQQRQHQPQGPYGADPYSFGYNYGDEEAPPVGAGGDRWQLEDQQHRAAAGILSNLLRLYGNGGAPGAGMGMHRGGGSGSDGSRSSTGSYYGPQWERDQELRRRGGGRNGGGGGRNEGEMRRAPSAWTVGTSLEDKVFEPEDPRAKAALAKDGEKDEKGSGSAEHVEETEKAKEAHKAAAKKGDELAALDAAEHRDAVEGKAAKKKNKYKKYAHRDAIVNHVATLLQKQEFILKLAKALMTFGAPSHRLESQLNATAAVLGVNAQFIHVPSVVIASFGDSGTHTSDTKFIKASGGLNLGALHAVHGIYRDVVHDEMGVDEGVVALERILKGKPLYNLWQRIAMAALCAGIISPMGFAGSFVDAFASGAFGGLLAFLNLFVARKNAIFSNIFEISVAALISFAARGLSTTGYFCYESVASSGVVMVLPGYIVLCGSLELASKNLIAGSVRMVYAIIYTLFLGFSIAVGSDVWYLFDPSSRSSSYIPSTGTTIEGTFASSNSSIAWQGSFTFTNSSSGIIDATQASLQKGSVMCYRDPSWEWWRQGISIYWLILLVPVYSTISSLANMQPLRSRELPVMVVIAVIGYVANRAATTFIFERSDIVSFIGATVIGLLGNLYSRVFNGTSFTAMATGVLFLVPGGIAAAGGLAMSSGGSDSYNSGLMIGFRMVQVAIGITIGLFFASFLVYSVGTKRRGGGLGFAF